MVYINKFYLSDTIKANTIAKAFIFQGASNFINAIKVAHLALKHRQNRNHKMRIVVFVGSPIDHLNSAEVYLFFPFHMLLFSAPSFKVLSAILFPYKISVVLLTHPTRCFTFQRGLRIAESIVKLNLL